MSPGVAAAENGLTILALLVTGGLVWLVLWLWFRHPLLFVMLLIAVSFVATVRLLTTGYRYG